jgi:transcriptional regulator GlxA family with amidase domain
MKNKRYAAFLFDRFADHQLSMILTALGRGNAFELETFSTSGRTLVSASGMRITPHTNLANMAPEDFDLLLLPGGSQWERGDNLEIFPLIMAAAGLRPLIAIGEAILALADLGLLDNIPHTGDSPGYLERFCPEYKGARFFRPQSFVNAETILTVSGDAFAAPGHGMLGLFDTLQQISANHHELFDPACQTTGARIDRYCR